MKHRPGKSFVHLFLAAVACTSAIHAQDASAPKLRVFILAGQSNMQGQAVVDLDHPQHYNGGRGTLAYLMSLPQSGTQFSHLKDNQGRWREREDVWVRYQTEDTLKKGRLTIGYTAYPGRHHFGPELQFGHVVGEGLQEPVLLVKTAWGGKSLYKDFRPPLSGGETGKYFTLMINQVQEALRNYKTDFPDLQSYDYQLAGFVWFQGWNDMVDEQARQEYEKNLVNLIKDVRAALNAPDLPVVIGQLGNGGEQASGGIREIRAAQKRAAEHAEFSGNVALVETSRFARPKEDSPNVGHGHHWFGNAESYFLIGDALGQKMMSLTRDRTPEGRVLILGDSISMGYTPFAKTALKRDAVVMRPDENCEGTTKGVSEIERWLQTGGGNFDVIHFNFGLHDLKRIDPQTGKASTNPEHPPQASIQQYAKQLAEIVDKLNQTGAALVFATTTPVPEGGVKPYRDPQDPARYNEVAREIMRQNNIPINDLYDFSQARLSLQRPVNVHFTREGSRQLARLVQREIYGALKRKQSEDQEKKNK